MNQINDPEISVNTNEFVSTVFYVPSSILILDSVGNHNCKTRRSIQAPSYGSLREQGPNHAFTVLIVVSTTGSVSARVKKMLVSTCCFLAGSVWTGKATWCVIPP